MPDCGHSIEVEGMDNWMAVDGDGQIQPKLCPRCKTSVRTCMRYGDIIKNTFADIAKAKQKIFNMRGNPTEFFNRCSKLLFGCRKLANKLVDHHPFIVRKIATECFTIDQLLLPKKNAQGKRINPSIGSDQRSQIEVNLDFIHRALEMIESLLENPMKPEFAKEFFFNRIYKLLNSLVNRPRISEEEYRALTQETDRLDYIRAYFVLQSTPSFLAIGVPTPENELIQKLLMKNAQVLTEEEKVQIRAALDKLGVVLNTGIGITDKERQEIVMAMGMTKGHWFKCPNGHIYAIGNCGGAMVESRCNECHAFIGGFDHRLRADNNFAGEMDDAQRPAWS